MRERLQRGEPRGGVVREQRREQVHELVLLLRGSRAQLGSELVAQRGVAKRLRLVLHEGEELRRILALREGAAGRPAEQLRHLHRQAAARRRLHEHLASEKLGQAHPEGPGVNGVAEGLAVDDLRRAVRERLHVKGVVVGGLFAEAHGVGEVDELEAGTRDAARAARAAHATSPTARRHGGGLHHDVLRLDVGVQHPVLQQHEQAAEHLVRQLPQQC
mmetsp:Transcript_56003/g.134217  ORF Transcript_56003/g.134217 Transcript_56003/m.134217 type:complete len:217 (+) Transcript_56003:167-817(+)